MKKNSALIIKKFKHLQKDCRFKKDTVRKLFNRK